MGERPGPQAAWLPGVAVFSADLAVQKTQSRMDGRLPVLQKMLGNRPSSLANHVSQRLDPIFL